MVNYELETVEQTLLRYGISIRDSDGLLKPAEQLLSEIAAKAKDMPDTMRRLVCQDIFNGCLIEAHD